MKKFELLGLLLFIIAVGFFTCILFYIYPRKVSVKNLGSGIAIENPICYQKTVAIGGFKNTYQTMCRERVEWHTGKKAGEEEVIEVPFPILKGEKVKLYEINIYHYFLPPEKRYEYQR